MYFTNRQDRYWVFSECGALSDWFARLVAAVCAHSYRLAADGSLRWPSAPDLRPDRDRGERFRASLAGAVQALLAERYAAPETLAQQLSSTAAISPLVQMGPVGVRHDEDATTALLAQAPASALLRLTSGYFNFTPLYTQLILRGAATFDILTAAPEANGFHGAAGLSGAICDAYTLLLRQFVDRVHAAQQQRRISVREWRRAGWTYHAKGLWYCLDAGAPLLTLVGSPNFGMRSVQRDLEAQVALMTLAPALRTQMAAEHERLYASAPAAVTPAALADRARRTPCWVAPLVALVRDRF